MHIQEGLRPSCKVDFYIQYRGCAPIFTVTKGAQHLSYWKVNVELRSTVNKDL